MLSNVKKQAEAWRAQHEMKKERKECFSETGWEVSETEQDLLHRKWISHNEAAEKLWQSSDIETHLVFNHPLLMPSLGHDKNTSEQVRYAWGGSTSPEHYSSWWVCWFWTFQASVNPAPAPEVRSTLDSCSHKDPEVHLENPVREVGLSSGSEGGRVSCWGWSMEGYMKEVHPCVFVWTALPFPWILTGQEAECWPTDNRVL